MNPFRVISQRKVLSLTQWSSKTLPESHPQSTVDQVVWTAVKFISKSTACPSVCLSVKLPDLYSFSSVCRTLHTLSVSDGFQAPLPLAASPAKEQSEGGSLKPATSAPITHCFFRSLLTDWSLLLKGGGALLKESECRNPAEFHCFCLLQWNKEEILLCIQSQVEIV